MKNQRCPFCGHDIQIVRTKYDRGITVAWLECEKCHAYGPRALVEHPDATQRAVARWNLRIVGRSGE